MTAAPPPPRRVLMTADAVGGVWTYALELSHALAPCGFDVTLATMGPEPGPQQRRDGAAIENLTLETSTFRLEWMSDPWDEVEAAGDWLLDLAATLSPDLVHLNGYAHAALPWNAPVLVVGHSCVISWWEAVKGEEAPPEWDRYRERVAVGLRAADVVIAPTHAMLDALQRHHGPLHRTAVIHNGLANRRHADAHRDPPDPGPPDPERRGILSVGRLWDEAKNIGALADAARAVPWPIRVAGEDRHPEHGHRGRGRDGLERLGVLSSAALHREMRRAAIFALPARYEPFGLSALEAASRGCALVLGDIPSLREVWGDAALYVPPDDPAVLADTLRSLIADPSERGERSAAARARADTFRAERMAGAYAARYADLLGGAP